MRITKLALFLLLGTLVGSRMAHSQPSDRQGDGRGGPQAGDRRDGAGQGDAGSQYFHQRLSPYGRWDTHGSYGEVWRPRVAAGWRPYTTGHWVYTDYGWTWAADESWGWAPFHYGRWYQDASLGWGWVPGNVWAPAWVDWRNGGGYTGWAALPPEAGFTAGVGVSFGGFDVNAALVPSYFCFVPERSLLEPRLGGFIVSPTRNAEILRGTSNLNGIAMVNGRVFNQGMSVQRMEQLRGSAVPRVQVASQAAFYRPAVLATAARQTKSESFVNRPAPRAASAATNPVPAGSRSASRQASSTRSAKAHAGSSASTRGQSRSATLPNQGQNGHSAVSHTRAQRASSNHATPPTQPRHGGTTAARSHAAPVKPPQHRTPQASARSNPPPRHVASGNPPPNHVAAATQHPAHAPAQAKPRQQPPP
ncbi:MAG TPA: DUF6600 domain-containing protein, partial [Thermoanaerobaculia bacterium]|nr:DUF6600 domain-containing protein [Thermoanaerobaculia bacterium]